ncbi:MAG TPA: protoporphyrinogen oxidase, partial [Myxococcaceae bacterium]|nr:protoporphyrinogen oxidase [Myxococcaceae bacterium]
MAGTLAIVGGGISGLTLAYASLQRDRKVVLLESSSRVGGAIGTHRRNGFLTETGPNAFIDREPAMRRLVHSLQLDGKLRQASAAAKDRFLFTRGDLRAIPTTPQAFLKSDFLPLTTRIRILGDLLTLRAPAGVDETLASFGARHFGKKASSILLDAVQSGIFAGDPNQLSAQSAFPDLVSVDRQHRSLLLGMARAQRQRGKQSEPLATSGKLMSFEGGMQVLIDALESVVRPSLQCEARVEKISPAQRGWNLTVVSDGQASVVEAEQLVLAIPAFAAAKLLQPVDGPLSRELDSIVYAPLAVVHVGYIRRDLAQVPQGLGFLVPFGEGPLLLGVLFISSIFPWRTSEDRVLLTCMLGGARRPELLRLDDERLQQIVKEELRAILQIEATPCFLELVRWERGIPQYNVGHQERLARIQNSLAQLP